MELGHEAEFGRQQSRPRAEVARAMPGEQPPQAHLGLVEVALPAGAEREPDLGVDLPGRIPVLGRHPHGLPVQLLRPPEIAVEQGDPAESGEPVGGLGPEAELLGQLVTVSVQPRRALVVAAGLGQGRERVRRLQPPPAVVQLLEQGVGRLSVLPRRCQVTAHEGLPGLDAARSRDSPSVAGGLEAGHGPRHHILAPAEVLAAGEQGVPEEPGGERVVALGCGGRSVTSGQEREAGMPDSDRVAQVRRDVAGRRQRLLQRSPGLGEPAAQVGLLGESGIVRAVPGFSGFGLARLGQSFEGVGADRLGQVVARAVGNGDQRVVDQPYERVEDVQVRAAHRLGGRRRAAAGEDGQAAQDPGGPPRPAGPSSSRSRRAGSAGGAAGRVGRSPAAGTGRPAGRPPPYAERPHPGGGQLQGEGDTVEAAAERIDSVAR
ncbi:hypothetical protein [Nonomuraea rubra]|uniref:hypothetical protein n=1 Tax=Nonomuraea rubra TaxID=46180 RepID=UPI0031339EA2